MHNYLCILSFQYHMVACYMALQYLQALHNHLVHQARNNEPCIGYQNHTFLYNLTISPMLTILNKILICKGSEFF